MDQLYCMRVFTRVVEQGSFARAADDLAVSRATITTAVAQLEQHLGSRLLHRTTRRLSLTDEGQRYYASCVRILGELAEADDELSRRTVRGLLRVSVPQSFARLPFFPALEAFLRQHPDLSVDVVLTDRAVNLVEEGIDCAIRGAAIPGDSLLVARQLTPVNRATCASPAYLEQHGTPADLAALASHDCIRFISPATGRPAPWIFNVAGESQEFVPAGRLAVTSYEAAAAAAEAGIGIVQVPEPLVYRELRAGRLRPLLEDFTAHMPPLCVVYPANRYLAAKVRVFADFLAAELLARGWWPETADVSVAQPAAQPSAIVTAVPVRKRRTRSKAGAGQQA